MIFKKTIYVIIINCDSKTSWYSDKIGTIQTVTDEIFPPDYILIDKHKNKKGLYPMIKLGDAKIIKPRIIEKIFKWLNFDVKRL